METGGYATTRGVRFQALWAVRQLLLLLAEEIQSVRIEPAGLEGEGVDIIVALLDGPTEYQQCKRSNRREGKWTMKELAARGVLAAIKARLRDDRGARFRLVSLDAAPDLRELAESARSSLDSESFLRDQVDVSNERRSSLHDFCASSSLDPENHEDLRLAYDLLRRCETSVVGDDQQELRELRSQSRRWVDGDPSVVLASLESWALEELRRSITPADVDALLRGRGLNPRRLERDDRIVPAVRRLQESFDLSLREQLLQGRLIPREETSELMSLLADAEGPRLIALHGPAGVGKSGVLLEATRWLRDEGVPFIPIRLDRQRPSGTPRQFGESLGLPESPALCLGSLAAGGAAVLLLDQLDALQWTRADSGKGLDVCRELVRDAMGFRSLRVVACCRSFDLEHDPQIHAWIQQNKARKLPVKRLSKATVDEVLASLGVDPRNMTPRQLDLLRTIQLLRTWEDTLRVTGAGVAFASERELLDAFWRSRLQEAEDRGIKPKDLQAAVEKIVDYLDRNGVLVAPERLLQDQPSTEDALRSLNVVSVTDGKITFCHQTYLDHQLAHLLLRRLDAEDLTLTVWLTSGNQGLSRRDQLRLVLETVREERFNRYLANVEELLCTPGVRFHLKQVVLELLGRVEVPRRDEIDIALSLLDKATWREHVVAEVLLGHPAWFRAAQEARLLSSWLESDSTIDKDQALLLIHTVVEMEGDRCSALLAPLVELGDQWPERVARALPMAPGKESASIFDLRVRLADMGVSRGYVDWASLGGSDLGRLVRLLSALLAHLDPDKRERATQADRTLHGLAAVSLVDAPVEEVLTAWKALQPLCSGLVGRAADEKIPILVQDRSWRAHLREFLRRLMAELFSRNAAAAIDCVEHDSTRLGELLLLETLPQVACRKIADQALKWLMAEPHRLRLRWSGTDGRWDVSGRAVEALTRFSSPAVCAAFEGFLLVLREPDFSEEMEWRHRRLLCLPENGVSIDQGHPRFPARVLAYPSTAGATAYHLLPYVPPERLSERGRRELAALRRKFQSGSATFFGGGGAGYAGRVVSPLPSDRLGALSDKTWLEIIGRNAARQGPGWRAGRYRGGFEIEKSSPETFSSDLESATVRQPGRFARLALRFPPDVSPLYVKAVIHGLGGGPQRERSGEEAKLQEIEDVLALPQVSADSSLAEEVARLMRDRADLDWNRRPLLLLAAIATGHPDPRPGELRVGSGGGEEEWDSTSLAENALNCTRGAAVFAIASLLFADPQRLEVFSPALESIVADPHPAVRAAAFRCCLAALESEPEQAIAWALQAVGGDEALLATPYFDDFLFYACRRHPADMEPTLRRMLGSTRADVVRIAAQHTVTLHLARGLMKDAARDCVRGLAPKRVGAAEAAAAFAGDFEHGEMARSILLDLVNDENAEVLTRCAEAFHDVSLDRFNDALDFLEAYAQSRAFQGHPFTLLHRLGDHKGSLVPFASCILSACRSLVASVSAGDAPREPALSEAGYYLPGILLRLYEQAQEGPVRDLCLDAWDLLLRARVVAAVDLTKKLAVEE